jgi:hypothetical protein
MMNPGMMAEGIKALMSRGMSEQQATQMMMQRMGGGGPMGSQSPVPAEGGGGMKVGVPTPVGQPKLMPPGPPVGPGGPMLKPGVPGAPAPGMGAPPPAAGMPLPGAPPTPGGAPPMKPQGALGAPGQPTFADMMNQGR